MMLLAAVCFAGGDVGVKFLGERLSPWQMSAGRAILGLLVALTLARFRVRDFLVSEWPWQVLLGLSSTLGMVCLMFAFQTLPLSVALPVFYLYPAMGALLSPLLNREKPSPADWLAIGLAFAAVICLTWHGGGEAGIDGTGVAWGFGAAFFVALLVNLTRRQAQKLSTAVSLVYLYAVNLVVCVPITLMYDRPAMPAGDDLIRLLLFLAAPMVIGTVFMVEGYKYISAHRGGVILTLEVVCGSLYGLMFLGEDPSLGVILGGGLMLASALVIATAKAPRRYAPPEAALP